MPSSFRLEGVPMLRTRAEAAAAIPSVSSGSSAMMGEAPMARRMLAQSLAVT